MSEEKGTYQVTGKQTFKELLDSPEMVKAREAIAEAEKQYAKEAEDWWKNLSYDDQLKAFFYVTSKIYESDVVKQGSFRFFLYNVMNFGMDAYSLGMQSHYMDLHNFIYEGVKFNKMKGADEIEFQSGDIVHRFNIPKDRNLDFIFDEENGKLIIKTEVPW